MTDTRIMQPATATIDGQPVTIYPPELAGDYDAIIQLLADALVAVAQQLESVHVRVESA